MRLRTTSTQRTYRYLRLSIVGVVVLLGVSLALQLGDGGVLGSVSAMYYTPARNVFVGGLCGVSLALLALSGRSVEQALLDLAAVLAAVVALVPTPVAAGDVSGVAVACPGEASCVPAAFEPEIANGVLSFGVVGLLVALGAVVLAVVQRTLTVALGVAIAAGAALVGAFLGWWLLGPTSFLLGAHNVATTGFFAVIAVVAGLAALRPASGDQRRRRLFRVIYSAISAGVVASLLFLAVVVVLRASGTDLVGATSLPLVLYGEGAALTMFAAFWAAQTAELWDDPDPRRRTAPAV